MTAKHNLDQALRVLNNTLGRGTPDKPPLELDFFKGSGGYVLTIPEKDGIPARPFQMARKYPAPLAFALEYAIEILRFAERENEAPGDGSRNKSQGDQERDLADLLWSSLPKCEGHPDRVDLPSGSKTKKGLLLTVRDALENPGKTAPAPSMDNLPEKAADIFKTLKTRFPDLSFSVNWTPDPYHTWDGDGPDPEEDGFQAYDVEVTARAIVNGETLEGSAYLGGSYSSPGEHCPEIHGYLKQMICEAFRELETAKAEA